MKPSLSLVLLIAISLGLACEQPEKEVSSTTFEHVLVVMCDDLATHALGYYGNELAQTPVIDQMAQEGIRFMRAYANSPMCTPSRASILTGRYPHATGTTLLRTALPDSVQTIAERLSDEGLSAGIFGKNHFNSALQHGFEVIKTRRDHRAFLDSLPAQTVPDDVRVRPTWKPFRDHARTWLNADRASSGQTFEQCEATYLTNQAMDFISQHHDKRSFTLLSFHEPHSPFNFSQEFQDLIDPSAISLPSPSTEDSIWIPQVFANLTEAEKKGITASYYQSVAYVDKNVGRILAHLDTLQIREKTLILFFSDHGYLLNHHGRFEKHMMWEEAVHVPLIMVGYGSGIIEDPVELVDIYPTILEGLGLVQDASHGLPLQAIVDGSARHEFILSEYLTDNKYMMMQSPWKYIYASGKRDLGSGYATGNPAPGPSHRLYNSTLDPHEQQDVAAAHPDIVQSLQEQLLKKLRTSHPLASSVSRELPVAEQLRLLAEPPEGENPDSY